jgi:hypothetical protein
MQKLMRQRLKLTMNSRIELLYYKICFTVQDWFTKSMRGMMTNSIYQDQWLNMTSESRDRI